MTQVTIQSSPESSRQSRRERFGLFALAGLIVTAIGGYLALSAVTGGRDGGRKLFRALREGLVQLEAERAKTALWPEPSALADRGIPPFAGDPNPERSYRWQRFQQGVTVNYLGHPIDPSRPAWLLTIQEPEPGALPDPAPNDDEHHRLPDGTTLHIYVWQHRYGGQVPDGFVPQPQNNGWIGVFSTPPSPVAAPKR
ncbi:MAG: hypothetical protein DMF90_15930 [Acidobacteria bacterium]|nr:MAG: hypothetical protein DMF90_15930 [Acidobacteriota bacterium]